MASSNSAMVAGPSSKVAPPLNRLTSDSPLRLFLNLPPSPSDRSRLVLMEPKAMAGSARVLAVEPKALAGRMSFGNCGRTRGKYSRTGGEIRGSNK
eukprot:1373326-Amorphochlora_amoeboformis.AAC.1